MDTQSADGIGEMENERQQIIKDVQAILLVILANGVNSETPFPLDTPLYETGIGLDSLDTAAFSSMLESAYGTDPYSAGDFPQTLEDVVRFYEGIVS